MTGLPAHISACLFDLDGVLTSTAVLHQQAWKETFDGYLLSREGVGFTPFSALDYNEYVDGRPRADGVRTFLTSRGIELPEGAPDDPADADTINGVGNRKNELLHAVIEQQGVDPYPGSVRYLEAARDAGLAIAVVTSSANGEAVLAATGLDSFVQARIDGVVIVERQLKGKPAPDSFLAGAAELGVDAGAAAVFEDAISGVQAGRAGNFGYVVGVDRVGQAEALQVAGADIVVQDLDELLDSAAVESS
ncbi:MAG: beta-phosphoglucomutase family hydrolase [Nocardioidaceae bacterium]|nr:beta-phosphoglucomutase family hydrolase [Nocardioidaceae bacterium]